MIANIVISVISFCCGFFLKFLLDKNKRNKQVVDDVRDINQLMSRSLNEQLINYRNMKFGTIRLNNTSEQKGINEQKIRRI